MKLEKSLLCLSFPSAEPKNTRIKFSASWWSGNKKHPCFVFMASRALFQRHVEFNRLLKRNFLACYIC